MSTRAILISLVLATSSASAAGPVSERGFDVPFTAGVENLDAEIPQHTLGQLVYDAISAHIAPADSRRRVAIAADGMEWSWLPTITNTEFVLVPWDERHYLACQGITEYLFFRSLEKTKRGFKLAVTRTDGCSGTGEVYSFRWRRGRLARERGHEMYGFRSCPCTPGCPDGNAQPN